MSAGRPSDSTGRRRTRWVVAVLLVAVVALAVVVTLTRGFSLRDRVPITSAVLSEPNSLTLLVGTCGGEPELDLLHERDDLVEVAVVSTRRVGGPGGDDCLDPVEARLQSPLGDRRLVDVTTGDDVAVEGT